MNIEPCIERPQVQVKDKLSLYYYDGCPFCVYVRSVIDALGVDIELRNIHRVPQHREDLLTERGRGTVPVLRIESPDGEEQWMPESRDIAQYLQETYG